MTTRVDVDKLIEATKRQIEFLKNEIQLREQQAMQLRRELQREIKYLDLLEEQKK